MSGDLTGLCLYMIFIFVLKFNTKKTTTLVSTFKKIGPLEKLQSARLLVVQLISRVSTFTFAQCSSQLNFASVVYLDQPMGAPHTVCWLKSFFECSSQSEWLFRSENCDAVAVFGQKVAAWLQGQKKLRSTSFWPNDAISLKMC